MITGTPTRTLHHDVISLVHWVELSKSGWQDELAERSILAALWLRQKPAPIQQIKTDISKKLNYSIRQSELVKRVQELEKVGDVIGLPDGRYKLSLEASGRIRKQVESFESIEKSVQKKFSIGLKLICSDADSSAVWRSFIDTFLVPLVDNEGAKAYDLLVGKSRTKFANMASYLDVFLRGLPVSCREKTAAFVRDFLYSVDEETSRFFLSYLDAYFLLSVSGLPAKAINNITELSNNRLDFMVFVDTNFVYSILGLHDNPSNEAANDLIDLSKSISNDVKLEFYIWPSTLAETQQSLAYHKKRLESAYYPPNVAQAAATSVEISGVYKTFFEQVSKSGHKMNAADYFAPYEDGLVQILMGKGVSVFSENRKRVSYDVEDDIDAQLKYEREKYFEKAKSERQITHDVTLWHFVQDQREGNLINSPLEAKYWIVTLDYRLINFDKFKVNKDNLLSLCIHPSQLIQVLRFFVPRSSQFEKTLLGVVKSPTLSKEFDTEAERISMRIAQILARYEKIDDIPVDTLKRVLADSALRQCLTAPVSEEEETEAVDSALAKQITEQNSIIKQQAVRINELERRANEFDKLASQYVEEEKSHELINSQIEKEKNLAQTRVSKLESEVKILRAKESRRKSLSRLLLGFFIAIGGIGGILILPQYWPWLDQHPSLRGLQFSIFIIIFAFCWGIADSDKERRQLAIIPLLIGAVLVIGQILGR